MELNGSIICPMPAVYTTRHLRPVTLWQFHLNDGRSAAATLAPTVDPCVVSVSIPFDRHRHDHVLRSECEV
jgi:hypothetical protein